MEQLQQRDMLGGGRGSGASQDMLRALAAGYNGGGAGGYGDPDVIGTALPLALRRDVLARLDAEGSTAAAALAGGGPDGFAVHNPLSAKPSAASMSGHGEPGSGGGGTARRASLAAALAFAAGGTSGFVEGGSADGSPARQGRASMHNGGAAASQHRRASRVSMRVRAGTGSGTGPGGDQKVAPGADVSPLYDPWLMGSPATGTGTAAGGSADPEKSAAAGGGPPARRVVRLSASSPAAASRHRASHAAVSFAGSGSRKGR